LKGFAGNTKNIKTRIKTPKIPRILLLDNLTKLTELALLGSPGELKVGRYCYV